MIQRAPSDRDAYDAMLRTDLSSFTQKAFSIVDPGARYLHNWHIDAKAEYLTACTTGEITRLIINEPPRYLKSISGSVSFPAWVLGKKPSAKFVASSYAKGLALKLSVNTRLVMQDPVYRRVFPGTVLVGDQNEKSRFVTSKRGGRIATSTDSQVTGDGGDYLIIDDPQNPKQASNKDSREKSITWFEQTFYTRLDDKKTGVIILIMQRLHENDLTGYCLEQGGWEHLNLPAVAQKKTIIDFGRIRVVREKGDILHEEREGVEELAKTKKALGEYGWAGQYLQNPVPMTGGMIKRKWVKRYKTPPANPIRIIQSWDTASKAKEINDPSVCSTWFETELWLYLIDVYRERLEFPGLKAACKSLAAKWKPDAVLIEDKSSGIALIQELKAETRIPVIAINPVADKITRMSTESPKFEAGLVYLPESAPWLTDYESEIFKFPLSEDFDQVDSTSQFLNWVSNSARKYAYDPVKAGGNDFKKTGTW